MKRRKFAADATFDALLAGSSLEEVMPPILQEGVLSLHPRGFGFVTSREGSEFYVRASHTAGLLLGDVVTVEVSEARPEGEAEVLEVRRVQRRAGVLLCELRGSAGRWRLLPDEPCGAALAFEVPEGACEGEVWVVSVPAYEGPVSQAPLVVSLVSNLGARTREGFLHDYARARYGFAEAVPPAAMAEVARAVQVPIEGPVSEIPFVTIDGESTRDIDDAVWAQCRAEGGWDLQVAIADVSWYVQPGSALDKVAAERGTSLYLPGMVVPMLPEALSTGLCSLQPQVARRAVVLTMHLAADGAVLSAGLERRVICSTAQLTYTQVAAFMAGERGALGPRTERTLAALADLYAVLTAVRGQGGRLEFEDVEPSLVTGADGQPVLQWNARTEAHKLIEELMLVANREAARLLARRYGTGLFRHQPPPAAERWEALRSWAARRVEHALPVEPSLPAMAALLEASECAETRAGVAIRVRGAMSRAAYVVPAGGDGSHFSLNFDCYTHFTSPIRRYADLLVHRLLLAPVAPAVDFVALAERVAHCSQRSSEARKAERWVWDRLKQQVFVRDVPHAQVVAMRVVRVTGRGARVVALPWQCAAWLSSTQLRAAGFAWDGDCWASATQAIEEGRLLQLRWTQLDEQRAAYPELQVGFARAA